SLALDDQGHVWAWGANDSGQLGNGAIDTDTVERDTLPARLEGLDRVVAVSAGSSHSLALRDDGTVWAWGANRRGQLGIGADSRSLRPAHVLGLDAVRAISAGGAFSLALRDDGTVWAWGRNDFGQLGSGTRVDSPVPLPVPELDGVVAIDAGGFTDDYSRPGGHSLALKGDGTVWAWGWNQYGQLGNAGSWRGPVVRPAPVPGVSGAKGISAGGALSLVLSA